MRTSGALARIALLALVATRAGIALAQTTGTIVGTIQDAHDGKPVSGALVVAESPALQGEQSALSGTEGTFRISLLPPGDYTLTAQADGYRPTERPGVRVDVDKTIRVTLQLVPETLKAEEVVITTEAPVIDQGSNTSGAVIPENFARNVPTGRSFEDVLSVAPSATSDRLGTTFRGSSSPENSWIIDGVNTTDIVFANGSTLLPNEFVKQVEVKTGGYQAEYGRATGGVVNVVTKSGGNAFSGDVYVNFSSGALALPKRSVGSVNSVISSKAETALALDFGFDLGGYIVKDRLWFFVGVTPFIGRTDYTRTVHPAILDAEGNPVLDANGEPIFGGAIPSLTKTFDSKGTTITRIAKLTYNVNENNSAQLSYLGNPGTESGVFYSDLNGTENAFSAETAGGAQDVSALWTSKLFDKNMLLEAWYGMHQQTDQRLPFEVPAADAPLGERYATVYSYDYLPPEFANVSGCEDVVPGDDATSPCTSFFYGSGPVWFQEDNYSIRHTANLKLTNFVQAGGEHAISYGGDLELVRFLDRRGYVNDWAYQANEGEPRYRRAALGTVDESGDFVPTAFLESDTFTRNTSLFLQDAYEPVNGLTINAGVRWETQSLYGADMKSPAVTIGDNWAPRVGVAYDWTGRGRSKIEASFGRYYEAVPMDINGRSFSAEGYGLQWIADDGVTNLTPDLFGVDTYVLGGETAFVIPDLGGQFVDEYAAGVQYEVIPDLAVGVTLVHRSIGRVIEDVSPDGGGTYIIANPGDRARVDASIETLEGDLTALGGRVLGDGRYDCAGASDADRCDVLVDDIGITKGVADFPKPVRDYDAVELMARKNFSRRWYLVGSLTLSRTVGNYPGLYTPENGQLDPNITTQYDLVPLLANRTGPLYTDRPVYLKVDGYYLWGFGLVTGISFRAHSGRPVDATAADPSGVYGLSSSFLLPRGAGGRLAPVFDLDVNLGYDLMVTEGLKVGFNVVVFNVLNFQETTGVDDNYTYDAVRPVVGGTFEDIEVVEGGVHVPTILNASGLPVVYNRNYRQPVVPTQVQDPLTVRLGVRVSF